ncbi:unnamed protein product [Trichogramma brassicae]|uniref:Uncharacterized protein n=1 Tax=Trichogramma brassicae TaxID=86971 RepID=A0A6H5J496_9HYME|nr:unnamed protein product [Trichogramma brassicae]
MARAVIEYEGMAAHEAEEIEAAAAQEPADQAVVQQEMAPPQLRRALYVQAILLPAGQPRGATTTWSLYNALGEDMEFLHRFREGRIRITNERMRGKVHARAMLITSKYNETVGLLCCGEKVKDTWGTYRITHHHLVGYEADVRRMIIERCYECQAGLWKMEVPTKCTCYARRAAGSAGAWVDGRSRRDEPAGEQLAAVDADEDDDPLCGDCGVHDTENHRRPSASKICPAPDPRRVCDRELRRENESYRRTYGGFSTFIFGRNNLHKEVIKYSRCLEQAILALKKTKQKQVPPRPPSAEKAVCTSPIFSVNATGKRPATSPLATHATPKRQAVAAASKQPDENNSDVGDQDGFVPVNHRRHRERKQTATTTAGSVRAWQLLKPRPAQRRVHHRPDAIVIKAKDASIYANILRTLKANLTLQQTVGSSVQNIRRSAAGALVLQLKKNVDNASTLGAKLDQVLGDVATATALQHTTMIEIRDLDECATKEEIAEGHR